MATLVGQTTAGTSGDTIPAGGVSAYSFVASATGTATKMWAQFKVANAGLSNLELGIYANAAGAPGALLGSGARGTDPGSGLFSLDLAPTVSIVSGTTYHLAFLGVGEALDYQGSASGSYREDLARATLPATFVVDAGPFTFSLVIYATSEEIHNAPPGMFDPELISEAWF